MRLRFACLTSRRSCATRSGSNANASSGMSPSSPVSRNVSPSKRRSNPCRLVARRVVRMVVGAVEEASLLEAGDDDAPGLIREQVRRAEELRGPDQARTLHERVDELGEDLAVVDELGEAEEEVPGSELVVELRVRVCRRARDDLTVPHDAQQLDVPVSEVRRLACVEVAQLLTERRDELRSSGVDAVGERDPLVELAAARHRSDLEHVSGPCAGGRNGAFGLGAQRTEALLVPAWAFDAPRPVGEGRVRPRVVEVDEATLGVLALPLGGTLDDPAHQLSVQPCCGRSGASGPSPRRRRRPPKVSGGL